MELAPDLQELAIAFAVSNHKPALLTPDFLAGSGVVPLDWKLARPPVVNPQASQIAFANGVSIVAQPGTIIFSESVANKEPEDVAIANIACKYATALPNLDYRAVGINSRRFLVFENHPDAARLFITKFLLAPGSWQRFGDAPIQANVTLAYTIDQRQLRLNIAEAKVQRPDKDPAAAVLFAGVFQYILAEESSAARLTQLCQAVNQWRTDLDTFQTLVNSQFLATIEMRRVPKPPVAAE